MHTSFYDLDYIIETNKQRLEEYNAYLQKVSGGLTNIILIYSALGIFSVSLIQHVLDADIKKDLFYIGFFLFSSFFVASLVFFIKLLLPANIAYLDPPGKYYIEFKEAIEKEYPGDQEKVDISLKNSYILELENALSVNYAVFRKKSSFYYDALLLALLAIIPYITCVGFHLSTKNDKIQKIELISIKNRNFKI